jgi:hypothetical protein
LKHFPLSEVETSRITRDRPSNTSAYFQLYAGIHKHTSAYVGICRHTSVYVSIVFAPVYHNQSRTLPVYFHQPRCLIHMCISAYVIIRQHTSTELKPKSKNRLNLSSAGPPQPVPLHRYLCGGYTCTNRGQPVTRLT